MSPSLTNKLILVVEDDVMIATDLTEAFADAGAHVVTHHNCEDALSSLGEWVWAGAILDYSLGDTNCEPLCNWLVQRGAPFIIYTGRDELGDVARSGVVVKKPASSDQLVEM